MEHTVGLKVVLSLLIVHSSILIEAAVVGVNYGMLGDNLPSPDSVVSLLRSRNITNVRLFNPNHDALNALQGSGIEVILGTLNQDLPRFAANYSFAQDWVKSNVIPYALNNVHFRCVSVGNEVIPSDLAIYVLPSMQNLNQAMNSARLEIPISTSVSTAVLGTSYPPSQGNFGTDVISVMTSITGFLVANKSPLLVNVYPYFAYIYNSNISLDYALFTSQEVVVKDGNLGYKNLFDAIIDATYAALEKVGGEDVDIVITESGWPSAENGDVATIANAQNYNNNLIAHVAGVSGTPRRPGKNIEAYVFAIFNENLKPPGTEENFGVYHPNMTEVYHVNFTS